MGEKIHISGVSGTAATALNNLAHTITAKTGTGPYTWTISTATTGLTASVGTAKEYAQDADTLTWAGEFDVPVRFDSDEFRAQMLESGPTNRLYSVSGLALVEIKT